MKKRLKMKKMKNKTETCKWCNGHGEYEDWYDDAYGDTHSLGWLFCENCNGSGKINVLEEFKSDVKTKKRIKKLFEEMGI